MVGLFHLAKLVGYLPLPCPTAPAAYSPRLPNIATLPRGSRLTGTNELSLDRRDLILHFHLLVDAHVHFDHGTYPNGTAR